MARLISNPSLSAISLSFGLPVRSIGILPIASEFAMSAILTTHAPHFAAGESTGSRKGELMAGRGSQTLKKRQKEQQRKDRKQLKIEKRLQRRQESEKREESGPEMGQPIPPPTAD